ncbi:GNAT family N-acetyltransferase [Chloroflexi bacterium TSY]|nr:GNAT family N-acetyltransferase [Chloroflexi bacterium TSY]
MNKPTIRKIRADELHKLIALYKHLHPHDAPLPPVEDLQKIWNEILANPSIHYFVIEEELVIEGDTTGKRAKPITAESYLVASCTLTIIPNLTRGARPYGVIENVVTDPAYRKRGYGTTILHRALETAWNAHCYKVMLMTGSKRAETLRFYEQAGFVRGDKTGFIARPA